jgi:hypothetical protein
MAVKTIVLAEKNRLKPYPKLMQADSGLVVLFENPCCGMVVVASTKYRVGHYSAGWASSSFIDFNNPITLENE